MGRKALVLGATGLVGGHLVNELAKSGTYSEIRVLGRRPSGHGGPLINEMIINMDEMHLYKDLFQVEDIFCCLGTTIKKAGTKEQFRKVDYHLPLLAAELARGQKARQFLVISSMGADKKSAFFYNRVKGEVEDALKKMDFEALHIFRPSLLLGERREFRLGEKMAEWITAPLMRIMSGKLKKYSPIHAETVAKAMAAAALANSSGIHIHESDALWMLASRKE